MQFNHIERILCYEDFLPVYNDGNNRYTKSQEGDIKIKTTHITVQKGSRVPIKEESNVKENLPFPSLSRTEVTDENMNRLPYSAIVSLTMDDKFTGNGVSVGRNGVLVGPCHISTCRHKPT